MRAALRRGLGAGLLIALLVLVTINGAVRLAGGGDPHLLSPRFLPEKIVALARWTWHWPFHLFGDCGRDPDAVVRRAARRHRVPEDLVLAVARAESGLRPHRISRAGAMGMMQIMPDTARMLGLDDPFDAAESADAGARYLARLWRHYGGDRRRVAAAYNAGPGVVPRSGPLRLPGETRRYVAKVVGPR